MHREANSVFPDFLKPFSSGGTVRGTRVTQQKTVPAAVINSSSSTSVTTRVGVLALKASKKF